MWSYRRHLRRKKASLRDLTDLHVLRVPLLRGLVPERGEVRRDGEGIEDLAVLANEPLDLDRVVVGPVLVRTGIDDLVTGVLEQRSERSSDRVSVSVVRPHDGDLFVGRHLRPEVRVREKELLDAEAVVERRLVRRGLAGLGAAAEIPRLPGHHRGDAGNARRFARVGNRVHGLRCGGREHEVDLLSLDQLVGDLRSHRGRRLPVAVDDLDQVVGTADRQPFGDQEY